MFETQGQLWARVVGLACCVKYIRDNSVQLFEKDLRYERGPNVPLPMKAAPQSRFTQREASCMHSWGRAQRERVSVQLAAKKSIQ